MIGRTLGRYEIVRQLGAGGMGVVYAARDTELERDVAIKVLPDEFARDEVRRSRFEREAKAIAALHHPNICTLYDIGHEDGVRFLVMELIDGVSLEECLTKGRLTNERVLEYGAQIADALDLAHRNGIVHRDLKPGNVMLTKAGVKLLDFGLAQMRRNSAENLSEASTEVKTITAEGTILGTLPYMAPEQLHGKDADSRTDIFALGAVLYEMLTGIRAFAGNSRASLISAIISGEPQPIRTLQPLTPPSLEHVIRKCLEKEPDDRWQSAHDIATELRWIGKVERETVEASSARPISRWSRTIRAAAIALVLAVVLVAAVMISQGVARRGEVEATSPALPSPKIVRLTWEAGTESNPSISPDGSSFVYTSRPLHSTAESDVLLRRIGGENPINLTKGSQAAISPDGQTIAFRSERDGGGIFLMGATGESVRRLTDIGFNPAWSPDGRTIAFSTSRTNVYADDPVSALWAVDVLTGSRRKIYDGDAIQPTWSPSGIRIAFVGRKGSVAGRTSIWTIPADGGTPKELIAQPGWAGGGPQWSAGWIWYHSPKAGPRGLWRIRADERTGDRQGDPEPVLLSTNACVSPSVSRDGRRLLFGSGFGEISVLAWDFDSARGRVSENPRTIVSGTRGLYEPLPSPDGEWLAIWFVEHGRNNQQDIVLLHSRTGETRRLTNDDLKEGQIHWAPDGSVLYFLAAPAGKSEVWSLRPDGSGRELVVPSPLEGEIVKALPSPTGRTFYIEAGARREAALIDLDLSVSQRKPAALPLLPNGRRFAAEAWSPDGRELLGYALDESAHPVPTLLLCDLERRTYREVAKLENAFGCRWLPDSRQALLLLPNGSLQMLDIETGRTTSAGSLAGQLGGTIANRNLSTDGRTLYANHWIEQFDIWMLDYGDRE